MKKNNNLPHLLLAVDAGASAIKVVASLVTHSECLPFTIDTEWVDLSELHESYHIPEPNPTFDERSVWVGHGDKYYAIGNLAKTKYNVQPFIKPVVQLLTIKPEGYGVLDWHRIYGAATDRDIGVIMFGYRNTSVLFSVSGELTDLSSSEFGFYHVLDRISRTSGGSYDPNALAKPVWDYLIHNDESGFKSLYKSITNRELELSMIKQAIAQAMIEYQRTLQVWLSSSMQKTGMIVLAGGNAEYIADSLNSFLENYATYHEGRGYMIQKHIGGTDGKAIPAEINDTGMAVRYLDIYCLWLELSFTFKKEVVSR